ncbi:MAG: thiol:disulfide interchange protein DsbA/DsbL [Limnohabitans sp.]|jgi:thiol:disulfide interchange protein DsbA|nr:thiol:disulfide interchange protein DsbA/DsbL [Burkholderiales bacterium]
MKRRPFTLACAATLLTPTAFAQGPLKLTAGKDYVKLDRPIATETEAGKIEVLEFFWYSCPHCNTFEPTFAQWVKTAPKDVVVRRVPVAFRDDFAPQQRLFFTLEAMGFLEKLHSKVFQAVHGERLPLSTEASILAWVEKQGVDKVKFAETFKSFGVASKLRRAVQLQNDFKIEGVPSLGVAGRYYVDGTLAGSMERALQVAEVLLAQVRQGRT